MWSTGEGELGPGEAVTMALHGDGDGVEMGARSQDLTLGPSGYGDIGDAQVGGVVGMSANASELLPGKLTKESVKGVNRRRLMILLS